MSEILDIGLAHRPSTPSALQPRAPLDAAERGRALDTTQSFIVEAPAGSGKTGLLIQRFLALLADPALTAPEQVVAITFTRAATAEIRSRVLDQLRASANDDLHTDDFARRTRDLAQQVLERDRQLGWQLLQQPRRLRVLTIDGLCAEIVRSLPMLAGGTASLQPTEDPEALYREAAQRALLRLGQQGSPEQKALSDAIRDLLLHREGDLGDAESLLADMLQHREQWSELVPFSAETLNEGALEQVTLPLLNRSLHSVIGQALSELMEAFPPGSLDQLAGLAFELAHAPPYQAAKPHPLHVCRDLVGTPAPVADLIETWQAMLRLITTRSGKWRSRFYKNHIGVEASDIQQTALQQVVAELESNTALLSQIRSCLELPPPTYPAAEWAFAKSLFRVLHATVAELGAVFQEHGLCDFAEFSIVARRALSDALRNGRPLEVVEGIRHLLVDELQDTSSRQYDLLERLTSGWDGNTRTLFLVGDPKQSIYIFRQARVERFIQAMRSRRLGAIQLQPLHLSANFRSQPHLVHAANAAFQEIFSPSAEVSGLEYANASAMRAPSAPPRSEPGFSWNLSLRSPAETDDREIFEGAHRADATTTRAVIEAWLSRPLPAGRDKPWRVAVLVQNRQALAHLTRELRRSPGLPFKAIEIEELGERQEILDMLALTRALLHPGDRIAWLAALRAPWCGLMLADLHQLTGADDPGLRSRSVPWLLEHRMHTLSTDGQLRATRASTILRRALTLLDELRLPDLVGRAWRSLGGDLYLDEVSRENVGTFFRLLRALDHEAGRVDYDQLLRRVDRLRAAPSAAPAQIDFMTIHGAKGLEWDFVVLPELDRPAPSSRAELLLWEELASGDGILLAPVQRKGELATALQGWLLRLQAMRLQAERRRLFYVAATRAREHLHLFGTVIAGLAAAAPNRRSLLEAAWPAAQTHLPPAPSSSGQTPALSLAAAAEDPTSPSIEDLRTVLRRLPSTAHPLPPHAGGARPSNVHGNAPPAVPSSPPAPLARAVGNVLHALLEHAAAQAALGRSFAALAETVAASEPRTSALLRAEGVGPRDLATAAQRIRQALGNTLSSPLGQWILAPRPRASNELALTSWDGERRGSRIDRVFHAGPQPLEPGTSHLWIVDYKASSPGSIGLETFLAGEQTRYRDQLEGYADLLRPAAPGKRERINLGLWFPVLGRLVWWVAPEPGTLPVAAWHVA